MKIGDVIRKAREEAGFSQQELADKTGVSRVYIWMLEKDAKSPTLNVFENLAQSLGVRPSTLLVRAEKVSR